MQTRLLLAPGGGGGGWGGGRATVNLAGSKEEADGEFKSRAQPAPLTLLGSGGGGLWASGAEDLSRALQTIAPSSQGWLPHKGGLPSSFLDVTSLLGLPSRLFLCSVKSVPAPQWGFAL